MTKKETNAIDPTTLCFKLSLFIYFASISSKTFFTTTNDPATKTLSSLLLKFIAPTASDVDLKTNIFLRLTPSFFNKASISFADQKLASLKSEETTNLPGLLKVQKNR